VELTEKFKEKNMFKVFKRTEGVSTTDITGRLLKLVEDLMHTKEEQGDGVAKIAALNKKFEQPP